MHRRLDRGLVARAKDNRVTIGRQGLCGGLQRDLGTAKDENVLGTNVGTVECVGNRLAQIETAAVGCVLQGVIVVLLDQCVIAAIECELDQFGL